MTKYQKSTIKFLLCFLLFKFLSDNPQRRFTRAQIGLAVGLSSGGGSFATYMSTLKRNKLIIEQGGESRINPDL